MFFTNRYDYRLFLTVLSITACGGVTIPHMARPREFDTEKAIEAICDKFWAEGYEATGIAGLEDATGLARARLYAAFGSKREMLYKSIDFYLENMVEAILGRVDNAGLEGVTNFFRAFAWINVERPERAAMGCLVVNSMVEFGGADAGVAARAVRYRDRVRMAFRSALERSVQDGYVVGDVETMTDLAFMMLMGLYVSVKGGASLEEIKRFCSVAIEQVESWRLRED